MVCIVPRRYQSLNSITGLAHQLHHDVAQLLGALVTLTLYLRLLCPLSQQLHVIQRSSPQMSVCSSSATLRAVTVTLSFHSSGQLTVQCLRQARHALSHSRPLMSLHQEK